MTTPSHEASLPALRAPSTTLLPAAFMVVLLAAVAACSSGATPTLTGAVGTPCQTNTECLNGESCISQVCTQFGGGGGGASCQTTSDCGAGSVCVSGTCAAFNIGGTNNGTGNGGNDAGETGNGGNDAGNTVTGGSDYCKSCQQDSDCGATGNFCLGSRAAALPTAARPVPRGSPSARPAASAYGISNGGGNTPVGYNCFPSSGTCSGNPGSPDAGNPGTPDAGNPGTPDAGHPGTPDAGPVNMGGPAGFQVRQLRILHLERLPQCVVLQRVLQLPFAQLEERELGEDGQHD